MCSNYYDHQAQDKPSGNNNRYLASPLWKEHSNGYGYANFNRLFVEEPATRALLKQEAGTRAETTEFIYYVNFHEKYGWSVGRKRKSNHDQHLQRLSLQQQPQTQFSSSIETQLQELRQQSSSMVNRLEKISEILQRLESKIESHQVCNEDQVEGSESS